MSAVNPHREEFNAEDGYRLAQNVSWVIRTLWGGAVAIILATAWAVSLANDVEANKAELAERKPAVEAVSTIAASLQRIEAALETADVRQRAIQDDVTTLKTKVEAIEEELDDE